jgi:hypothetical protein
LSAANDNGPQDPPDRVEKVKAGGGRCYGYDVMKRTDDNGDPIRGERTINQPEAAIIRLVLTFPKHC